MREILVILEELEALHLEGLPTPLDHARRLAVFVVNSLSTPPLDRDQVRSAPGSVASSACFVYLPLLSPRLSANASA